MVITSTSNEQIKKLIQLKEKSKGEDIFKKERSKNKKKMKDKTDIIFSLDKEE